MINLLPADTLAQRMRDYRRRKRTVAGFLVALVLLVAIVLAGVNYLAMLRSRQTAEASLVDLKNQAEAIESVELATSLSALARQSKELGHTNLGEDAFVSLLEHLLATRPETIKLNEFRYAINKDGIVVQLGGSAGTRASLLAYIDRLRHDSRFTAVDSPISNLIKESNVNFVLSLSVASSTLGL